jgi:hypothetical protein
VGTPGVIVGNGSVATGPLAADPNWGILSGAITGTTAGAVAGAVVAMFNARGTTAAPTPTQSGDSLGVLQGGGCSANNTWSGLTGMLDFQANELFSTTNQGTRLRVRTTPNGAVASARVTSMLLQQGMQLGAPAGTAAAGGTAGDMGLGTLNVAAGLYVNGAGAAAPSISWLAGANPNNAVILIANRAMVITGISAVPTVAETASGTVTVTVMKNGSTAVSTTFNCKGTAGTVQPILSGTPTLAANDYLSLSTSGTFTAGVGNITVYVA